MAGKITALVVQAKNKERVNVFIDGEFAFGLAMIEALRLRKGQQLSADEIAKLKSLDEIEVAHNSALHFLSFRPRSVAEVRRSLLDKEYSSQAVDTIIERLLQSGLIDDEAFARYWVENRNQFGPRSSRALRVELRQKGVADDAIRQALDGLDESEVARRAAIPQARRAARLEKKEFKKKLGDFLLRRGFGYGIIKDVINDLWEEFGQPQSDTTDDLDMEWGA
jgi:regulatory protein